MRQKYREEEEDILRKVPTGLEEFSDLSIFSPTKFNKIETESYKTKIIGDVRVSEAEHAVLALHTKFNVIADLIKGGLDYEQEAAFAKYRM